MELRWFHRRLLLCRYIYLFFNKKNYMYVL